MTPDALNITSMLLDEGKRFYFQSYSALYCVEPI